MRGKASWRGLALAVALAGGIASTGATGPGLHSEPEFSLTNHRAEPVNRATFAGRHALVYFGYTHCPDVCPLGLSAITSALNQLGETAGRLDPYFVTVDPQRDTVSRLALYVGAFHPRIVGVTGALEQVRILANQLGVRFMVAKLNGEVYVDHTSAFYLLDPAGSVVAEFDHTTAPAQIVAQVRTALGG